MSDVEILGWSLVVIGISCVPLGIVFSLVPMIPGPPVSASSPIWLLGGLHVLGHPAPGWVWFLVVVVALVGLLVALVDLLSPIFGKAMGRTSRSAMVGAYYGLGIAVLLSLQMGGLASATAPLTVGIGLLAGTWAGAVLIILGPLLGGFVGELAAMPRTVRGKPSPTGFAPIFEQATIAGLSQGGGLLVTTGAKVVYGLVVGVVCVGVGVLAYLS